MRVIRGRLVAAAAAVLALTQVTPVAVAHAAPARLIVGSERAVTAARPGNAQGEVAAAFHDELFFVVWQETSPAGTSAIYGARVKDDGTVLDANGILLSPNTGGINVRPRVAGGGGKFMVVWENAIEGTFSDLGAAVVTTSGKVQKKWALSSGDNGQTSPDVAWNGQVFLAVWQDEPEPGDQDIYGARVTSNGLTLDGCSSDSCPNVNDVGIPIAVGPGNQTQPIVSASPSLFLVGWTDATDPAKPTVRDTAVALNGSTLDTAGFGLTDGAGAQTQVAGASNRANSLFAWTEMGEASSDIKATTMQPGGEQDFSPEPLHPNGIDVSAASGNQTDPAVVRRRGLFVVAWVDERAGTHDVFASRVTVDGAVLDTAGVAVATGPRQQRAPALASAGPKVLAAYQRDVPGTQFGGRDRVHIRIIA
jgi:hypothetical protein